MSSRRILFCLPTASVIGGVETWTSQVVPYLEKRGWTVVVGLAKGLKYNQPKRFRRFHPHMASVVIDGRGFDREGRIQELLRCFQKVKPDIVVPLGMVDAFWAFFRWRAAGSTARLVMRNQGILSQLLLQIEQFGPHADCVGSASRLVVQFATDYCRIPGNRARHLPNGVRPPLVATTPGKDLPRIRIGYVGRFTTRDKRILDLVEFCKVLREENINCSVNIVGSGPADERLRSELETPDYAKMVRFHGGLPHEEVYKTIYPNLDVLVLFSESESFGIVLAEAMAHGVVPVSSEYLGCRSEGLVRHSETGLLFPVGDVRQAVACVRRLQRDPRLLQSLSTAGRRYVSDRLTSKRCLNQWHETLEEVLERPVQETVPGEHVPTTASGRLERLGLSRQMIHSLRRWRRGIFGPAVAPGGEEWPLFDRHHDPSDLERVDRAVRALEERAHCSIL